MNDLKSQNQERLKAEPQIIHVPWHSVISWQAHPDGQLYFIVSFWVDIGGEVKRVSVGMSDITIEVWRDLGEKGLTEAQIQAGQYDEPVYKRDGVPWK